MQAGVREIYVDPAVSDYIVRLVSSTRTHPDVYLGASPRGSIALYRATQALAGLIGRDYVIPDDVKVLAEPALAHRVIIKTSSSIHDVSAANVVRELLDSDPVEAARRDRRSARGPPEPTGRLTRDPDRPRRSSRRTDRSVPAPPARDPRRSCSSSPRSRPASTFLFFLVYLGLLIGGGSYILTRLGLADLEAGYAVQPAERPRRRQAAGDLHAAQHRPGPQAVARDPQPDDAARAACRAGRCRSAAARSARGSSGRRSSGAATSGSSRSMIRTGDPFGFFEASAGVGQGVTLVVYPRVDALPMWRLPPANIEGARAPPERTLQTTPLATTVRPYAPGDSMNRIHWRIDGAPRRDPGQGVRPRADRRRVDLPGPRRGRSRRGAGDRSTTEVAVRAAAVRSPTRRSARTAPSG